MKGVKYSICGNILLIVKVEPLIISNEIELLNFAIKNCEIDNSIEGVVFISEKNSQIEYRFFNSDGSEEILCGNSLFAIGEIFCSNQNTLTLTRCGILAKISVVSDNIVLQIEYSLKNLYLNETTFDVGTPHIVMQVSNIYDINWATFNNHKELNITLFSIINGMAVARTFERGVNKETFACGTGAISIFINSNKKELGIQQVEYLKSQCSYQMNSLEFTEKEIRLNMSILKKNIILL